MAGTMERDGGWRRARWRIAGWSTAGVLVLLPLLAMQLTDEVVWDLADFLFAGALVSSVGATLELTVRKTLNRAYRLAVAIALAAAFILVWANAAIGIIGSEDNPANLMFGGVLAVALAGALLARLRPDGMARALAATAVAQMSVAVIAVIAEPGGPASGPWEILVLNAFFAVLWLVSAWLFLKSARGPEAD